MLQCKIENDKIQLAGYVFRSNLLRISLQDTNGSFLYVSNKIATEFGHSNGVALENKHYSDLYLLSQEDLNLLNNLQIMLDNGESVCFSIYNSFNNKFYLQTNTLLENDLNNIKYIQSIYTPIHRQVAHQLYRINYLNNMTPNKLNFVIRKHSEISKLQEMIIFLLLTDKSQHEIANILGYSRSNVAKNISLMCCKFGVESKEKALIRYCLKNGYDSFIPQKLLETKIIYIPQ